MGFQITEQHRASFSEDGIVNLNGAIDAQLLTRLNECFEWAIANPGPTVNGHTQGDEFSFIDLANPAGRDMYEQVIADSALASLAADLWQSKYVGFLAEEVFYKKGRAAPTLWHQDTSYGPWIGPHWVNFWIPLVAHPAEYAIQVVRGSHKGVMYDGTTFNPKDPTEPMWGEAANFPRLPDINADRAKDPNSWDIVAFDVEPGDIVALHPHCLHAGGAADAGLPERRTLVFRFYGDESYYSGHLPDVPGHYDIPPIAAASGGFLTDGDLFRPADSAPLLRQ